MSYSRKFEQEFEKEKRGPACNRIGDYGETHADDDTEYMDCEGDADGGHN